MTAPEVTRPGLPAASVPAPPGPPVTDHDPSAAQAPATVAPRRRRRWRWAVLTLVALIVVAGLTAGLMVWAPWTPPPVLRPGGLAAGPSTANAITFHWARPATGPRSE